MTGQVLTLGKNSLIYGLGSTATRLVGLLMLPFFTAYLSPEDYGVLTILALVSQLAQSLFGLGLGAGLGPCYFEGESERQKAATVWTACAMLLASAVVLIGIAFLAPDAVSRLVLSGQKAALLQLTLIGVAINMLGLPFMLRLQFENRAWMFVLLNLATVLATIGMSIVLVAIFSFGVYGMVWGQVFGYLLGTIAAFFWGRRGLKLCLSQSVCSSLARVSLPLVPGFMFLLVLLHGNKYVLQELQGLHAVGVYGVGFNLGMASAVLVGAIQTAWYPFFMSYQARQDVARELFGRIFTYYTVGVGVITLLFYLFAAPVVHLLTRPAFHDAYRVIGLVATAQYFTGMFSLLLPALYFAREVAYVSVAQGVAAVAVVLLSLLLIREFSYFGAACALALATGCMVLTLFAWQRWRGAHYLKVHYEYARLLGFLVFFFACAAMLLIRYQFTWRSQWIIIPIALLVILTGAYLALSTVERLALREAIFGRLAPRRQQSAAHD